MTRVFVAQHPTEAHMVVGLLASRGIGAEVHGESLFSVRGEVPVTPATLPTVWVLNDTDAESARAILRDRGPSSEPGLGAEQPWKCGHCGEMVDPQFDMCWNCGNPRHLEQ